MYVLAAAAAAAAAADDDDNDDDDDELESVHLYSIAHDYDFCLAIDCMI